MRHALLQGVHVLALTDHDTTDGLADAQAAATGSALRLVSGVEISATWSGRTVHIVGLNIDAGNAVLQRGLARLRELRNIRAGEITARLERKGITGVAEGVKQLVAGPILSRTHFARYLVQAGAASDTGQAFKKYLSKGAPAYVSGDWAPMDQVVQWIHAAGGQAVLAHPGRYKLGSGKLKSLAREFRECGGNALEIYSGSQRPEDSWRLVRISQELELLASVGSDYHGPEQRWLQLGRLPKLPAECTPVWQEWR